MNIKYYLRDIAKEKGKEVGKSNSEQPIWAYITYNGQRLRYGTKLKVAENDWNEKRQQVRGSGKAIDNINQRLKNIKSTVEKIQNDFLIKSEPLTPDLLKSRLDSILFPEKNKSHENLKNILEYSIYFVKENPKNIKAETLKNYKQLEAILNEFARKNGKLVLEFDRIDSSWGDNFSKFLYEQKQHSVNNVDKHLKNIKVLMKHSLINGLHQNRNYEFIKRRREEAKDIYITTEEIEKILNLELPDSLQLSRDIFIFTCLSGLRISDALGIRKENWNHDYLTIKSKKTDTLLQIPLRRACVEILTKYNGQFPAISEQNYNRTIKDIAALVPSFQTDEIVYSSNGNKKNETIVKRFKLVKSHTGRRSYATNEYLNGTDLLLIRNVTGHKTEKDFFTYIKINQVQKAVSLGDIYKERDRLGII